MILISRHCSNILVCSSKQLFKKKCSAPPCIFHLGDSNEIFSSKWKISRWPTWAMAEHATVAALQAGDGCVGSAGLMGAHEALRVRCYPGALCPHVLVPWTSSEGPQLLPEARRAGEETMSCRMRRRLGPEQPYPRGQEEANPPGATGGVLWT